MATRKPVDDREITRENIEAAQIRQAAISVKLQEQNDILTKLDELRSTRKVRGGVGDPLAVPRHLREEAAIIITDADVDDALKNR